MDDTFHWVIQEYGHYGYVVLFVGVMLENAGVPVPGETAVLVAGFLASPAGESKLNLGLVILFTMIAAVIGDNVGFWLGHRYARPRLREGKSFLFLTPKGLLLAEDYFHRYGLWTVFFARFITGLRVIGAIAAGTAGMHWTRFLMANAAGALAWSVTISLLGYFFGHSFELLHKLLGYGGIALLVGFVAVVGIVYVVRHRRKGKEAGASAPEAPGKGERGQ